jgi:hypothetical protein
MRLVALTTVIMNNTIIPFSIFSCFTLSPNSYLQKHPLWLSTHYITSYPTYTRHHPYNT